ncbi:MAG TPA: selenide, water dikinase SelD [Pyrinomonadaceae bacterium]|nr:selenide, water dikinase SelD [Pyrinomonadaceae bacterium]
MAKLAPGDLAQVLSKLPQQNNENVIVGFDTSDDAGVFRLNSEIALVQTLDFFTPIADDPQTYGRIAAINSLNDVYAMGGTPLTALSIVCYPQKGDWDVLGEILKGGQLALNSEDVVVLGGHSVDDAEIKFGYSVTGIVEPKGVITNAGAKPGDLLVLTKPIGTGVISTGIKFGKASPQAIDAAMAAMTTSAREASLAMRRAGANACSDITGFGLLGHAYEMAKASRKTFNIESGSVPLLPDVIELIGQRMLTRGDRNNRTYVGDTVEFSHGVDQEMQSALFDPQTAGGLLISIEPSSADQLLAELENAVVIGSVSEFDDRLLRIT